ncbi:hypothetical protein JCM10213_002307 [Rhodosporidiobolus nylandii]
MLDRLPLELVDHVVRLALPQPFSFRQYREQQDTLLALCRTSRAMRAVAQPLLFEAVQLRTAGEVERFVEACEATKLGGRVRRTRLVGEWTSERPICEAPSQDLRMIADCCPNIVEVGVSGCDADLADYAVFSHLRRLLISDSSLLHDLPYCLPHLEELSLIFVDFDLFHLTPSLYPALRAVHFQHEATTRVNSRLLRRLVAASVLVSCDAQDVDGAGVMSRELGRVLVDWTPWDFARPSEDWLPLRDAATHVRVQPHTSQIRVQEHWISKSGAVERKHEGFSSNVEDMATAIQQGVAPHLTTIYLSTSFSGHSAKLDIALSRLRTACTARNIEVVDEPPFHPHYDSLVSHEFWRRCKALKAEEQRAKAKEEESKQVGGS